jgi:hypothetical protein
MPHYRDPQTPADNLEAAENGKDPASQEGQRENAAPAEVKTPAAAAFDLRAEAMRLDVVLAIFVVLLGGLLAAFPVRNSDFWMHLASGRRIVAGEPNFGVDPYAFTTSGIYWANTTWIYDVIVYGITRLAGGADQPQAGYLVVGAKGLLIALLALVMMMIRRRTEGLWAPAFCTMVGLLVMSPRLILQPTLISALFLAVTLFLLQRPRNDNNSRGVATSSKIYWLLPVLFVLWVNLDEWFLLGPITVALFLIGQLLQQFFAPVRTGEDAPEPGLVSKLALVLVVGLAACLINPFHIHAFVLPSQLSLHLPTELMRTDSYLRLIPISTFDTTAFQQSAGNVAMAATYLLILLGLISFVLTSKHGWRWWRLVIWAAFLFLGVYQARLMFFFAVVGAPIAALNLQDFARIQFGAAARPGAFWKLWSIAGRLVSCLICVLLMLLTWPGWLHGSLSDGRRQHQVALRLEPDESTAGAARQLAEWQNSGQIAAGAHVFNWIPDLPGYFAWYQPGSEICKGFLDYRFNLFPKPIITDYLEIRRALQESSDRKTTSRDLLELLRKHKIQYLAFNWADPFASELGLAIKEWSQWKILYMQGNMMLVQHVDTPDSTVPPLPPRYDPTRLAFAPTTLQAPGTGPGRGPQLQDAWQLFVNGPPVRPQETISAFQSLIYYGAVRMQWPGPYIAASDVPSWTGLVVATASSPVAATGAAPLNLILGSFRSLAVMAGMAPIEVFTQGEQAGPAGSVLLAIRYARQAIEKDPDHYQAYNYLGTAYNYVWRLQEDRWAPVAAANLTSPRQVLRRAQITTVLEQVLKIRPDEVEAHRLLMEIYGQVNCLDLAQEHRKYVAGRVAAVGPNADETPDAYRSRMENMEKQLKQLEEDLNKRRNAFEVAAQNRPLIEKARLAISHGLGQRALELMLESDMSALNEQEIRFVLELLLSQGRAEELEQVLREEFRRFLGISYDWFKAQASAALGNYDAAVKALENAADQVDNLFIEAALQVSLNRTFRGDTPGNVNAQRSIVELRRQQAEFLALAGMIALEQGKITDARANLEKSLTLGDPVEFQFDSKPIVKRYLRLLDRAERK